MYSNYFTAMNVLFVTLLTFSVFKETASELFKVVGPAATQIVDAGSDLVLPCSLQPNISAVDMMVEWLRPDLTAPHNLVHLYDFQGDQNGEQSQSYSGRTSLFKEELHKGNTSLKLSAVQPSDEGEYKCLVKRGSIYDDIILSVTVRGKGFHAGAIAVIIITVFGVLLMAFIGCILKDKYCKEPLHPLQCSVVSYMHLKSMNVRNEWNLSKYNTAEEGYRRLIPAISNCRSAILSNCYIGEKTCEILTSVLQSENSSLRQLDLSNNNLQDTGVERLCDGLKSSQCKLEILRLSNCNLGEKTCENLGFVLHSENCRLKELDLSNNNLQNSGVELLCDGMKSSHCKLEMLRLSNCDLGEKTCENLGFVLQSENCRLKELDLSNNNLQDSGVELLCDGMKSSHCKLETLRLSNCDLGEKTCENLGFVPQSENCRLKELDLSNNNLQDSGVELLCDALKSSQNKLETLRLAGCKLGISWQSLVTALQAETCTLKDLDFSNNDLNGMDTLFDELMGSRLEILRLASCNIGQKACRNLGSVLQSAHFCLRELDLSNNDLQDTGVELLSDGLKSSQCQLKSSQCQLKTLRLPFCLVTDAGCSSLDSALSSNPSHLEELDLSYNNPGDSGAKLLSARLIDPHFKLNTLRLDYAGSIRLRPGLRKYACELTLDPNTAHRQLHLSESNRKVTRVWGRQSYPDHPERFDKCPQIMCRESLTGRCYWEVEWSGAVDFAVTYKGIERKEHSVFGHNMISWNLFYNNMFHARYKGKQFPIQVPNSSSNRVGVYLDWPAGTLSYYSVSSDNHTLVHLHTFHSTFTHPVYAGFYVNQGSSVKLCQIE